jgi:hypothetical protein
MIELFFSSKFSLLKLRSFVVVQVVEMYLKVCKIATFETSLFLGMMPYSLKLLTFISNGKTKNISYLLEA